MKILVNAMVYEIHVVKQKSIQLSEGQSIGTCSYIDKAIYISDSLGQETLHVLIHEITHAYIYEYGIREHSKGATWNEEDLCVFFEHYGFQIINEASRIARNISEKGVTK
jgi:hypothetical protein